MFLKGFKFFFIAASPLVLPVKDSLLHFDWICFVGVLPLLFPDPCRFCLCFGVQQIQESVFVIICSQASTIIECCLAAMYFRAGKAKKIAMVVPFQ